jgi:thiamine biosynthesis lipoprotein
MRADPVAEARFGAMGSDVHIVVVGGAPDATDRARRAITHLERRWSRFLPDSEISALNAARGSPMRVSAATALLIELAVEGWRSTGGRFDPTVLDALEAAGYDRSFEQLDDTPCGGDGWVPQSQTVPGCRGVRADTETGWVRLPPGVRIDPGGIGKGLAADLVTAMLDTDGIDGALVNVGGDLRVSGSPGPDRIWTVDVDGVNHRLRLGAAGVATSSNLRRTWRHAGRTRHHLIDPATGQPSTARFTTATVVAATAWRAEVLSKATVLSRSVTEAARLLQAAGAAALLTDVDGRYHRLAGIDGFLDPTDQERAS